MSVALMQASDRILSDEKSPGLVFRTVAVSGDAFDEQYVIRRCLTFLAENDEKRLIVLTLIPDQRNATRTVLGCTECRPYPPWMLQYNTIGKENFPMGELMALDGNAVLRYRSDSGMVSETVLGGSDPRAVDLNGFKGRIAHLGMQGRMPKPWLTIYVVGAGMLDSSSGADYVAAFAHRMDVDDLSIRFRNDPWFIDDSFWFPLLEEHRGNPPSEAEFTATKTLECDEVFTPGNGAARSCSWTGLAGLP